MQRAATVGVLIALTALSAAAQQPLEYKVTVVGEAAKAAPGDHFLTFKLAFQMVFARTGEAVPGRIAKWFLPNQTAGCQLRYPKVEAAGEREQP